MHTPEQLVADARRRESERDDPYAMISELCTELRNRGAESDDPVLVRVRAMMRRRMKAGVRVEV